MSLDGYLATKDDDLSWLSVVQDGDEDYGYKDFNDTVDTYIVGRATYDVVIKLTGGEFPQAKQHKCYVITRQNIKDTSDVTFYNGDIEELIQSIRESDGKHIYCDGGAQIVKKLLEKNLIDEFVISIIPVILGDGKRLFIREIPFTNLKSLGAKTFESGLVQLHYSR